MTRDPSTLRALPDHPETPSIAREIAEHILTNPDFIFDEYQKLSKILSAKPSYKPREVSIIYRRELGNPKKNPQFLFDQMAVSWLILNTDKPIVTPVEMVNLVQTLSGINSSDLAEETSEEVEQLSADISQKVQRELLEQDDNDISAWVAKHAGEEE